MDSSSRRYSFEDIQQLIAEKEANKLELKNSSFVCSGHPYNLINGITDKSKLKRRLQEMLGKEVGAFANSDGGTLIIGVSDQGNFDTTKISEFLDGTHTRIDDWVASILRDSLEPPVEQVDCYPLTDGENTVVVIHLPVSEKAPHQATSDKRYYVRSEDSAIVANHWLIEAIRNRRIHPKLEVKMIKERSKITGFYQRDPSNHESPHIQLYFSITNVGAVLAKQWACKLNSHFPTMIEVFPRAEFMELHSPSYFQGASTMVRADQPLFPSQEVELIVNLRVNVSWEGANNQLTSFHWSGVRHLPTDEWGLAENDFDEWFKLDLSIFADSAPKLETTFQIRTLDLWEEMQKWVCNSGGMNSLPLP